MKKLYFWLSLFVINLVLTPIVAVTGLACVLIYRLILARWWRNDNLIILLLAILGILFIPLALKITGTPFILKILTLTLQDLLKFQLSLSRLFVMLKDWAIFYHDLWGWSFTFFANAAFTWLTISHRERMLQRENKRLEKRFSKDVIPPYLHSSPSHLLLLGTTGSGKSTFINDMASATVESDLLIIIDGKADTGQYSLFDNAHKLAQKYSRELVVLNGTNNPDLDIWNYNPFHGCTITQAKDLIITLTDDETVTKSSGSEHYKNIFEAYLITVLEIMELLKIGFSFPNILTCLNFPQVQSELLTLRDEAELGDDELNRFSQLYDDLESNWEDSKASVTKLETFNRGKGKIIFDGDKPTFNVASIARKNQILVVLIDEMSMPDFSQGLAKMVVQDVRNFIASRQVGTVERQKRVRLVLDEFSAYASKVMMTLLSRGRTAGVTVYLSTQSLGDLAELGEAFEQAIIENINRFVVFRQNSPKSAEMIANIIGTRRTVTQTERTSLGLATDESSNTLSREYLVNPDEIKELPAHTAFYIDKDSGKVFRFVNEWKIRKGGIFRR